MTERDREAWGGGQSVVQMVQAINFEWEGESSDCDKFISGPIIFLCPRLLLQSTQKHTQKNTHTTPVALLGGGGLRCAQITLSLLVFLGELNPFCRQDKGHVVERHQCGRVCGDENKY